MAAQRAGLLETVLCQLCLPDNEAIAAAEKELEQVFAFAFPPTFIPCPPHGDGWQRGEPAHSHAISRSRCPPLAIAMLSLTRTASTPRLHRWVPRHDAVRC